VNQYKVIISRETYTKTSSYLEKIKTGINAGGGLQKKLSGINIAEINVPEFLQLMVRTKKPQIYAESGVIGDGSDWTQAELAILGDITFVLPVTIFDNGHWSDPEIHNPPFKGTLLYTAGALLRNGFGVPSVDEGEVVRNGSIDPVGYYNLYERRLLPALLYVNQVSCERGRQAFITIPGLGCGQFAGRYSHGISGYFKEALIQILQNHGVDLDHIKIVYFDPHSSLDNERIQIHGIHFLVRPLEQGNQGMPQLCQPVHYEEDGDDFSDCEFFSFVAWDHVSWPGNDFYLGSRSTDDGVKAAATDTMRVMTGIEGQYDLTKYQYSPPGEYRNWEDVVLRNNLQLHLVKNMIVFPENGMIRNS